MGEGSGGERRWQKMRCWVLAAFAATLLMDGSDANSVRLAAGNAQDEQSAYQNSVKNSLPVIRGEDAMGGYHSTGGFYSEWSLRTLGSLIGRLRAQLPLFEIGSSLVEDGLTDYSTSTIDHFQTSDLPPSSPTPSSSISSISTSSIRISTTQDPMEAYCEVACEEGIAGPECDCPGHPVG